METPDAQDQTFPLGSAKFTIVELLNMLGSNVITTGEFREAIGLSEHKHF